MGCQNYSEMRETYHNFYILYTAVKQGKLHTPHPQSIQ